MTLADPAIVRKALDVATDQVSDAELQTLCDAVDAALLPLLTGGLDHVPGANCSEAAVGIAVQVWQSRYAPGGQVVGGDFQAQFTPHLVGPGLIVRYQGLLSPCMPFAGAVIA
jgi:hypothetical protein